MKSQLAIVLLANVALVLSYPGGAPSSERVCKSMNAGHGPGPQKSDAPYEVEVDKTSIRSGQTLTITLKGSDEDEIKGFYIQVRDQSDSPIGQFQPGQGYQTGNCGNLKDNAATHTGKEDKESVTLRWKAPTDFQGQVSVVATALKDFDTYWTFIRSDYITVASLKQPSAAPRQTEGFKELMKKFVRVHRRKPEETETQVYRKGKILNYNPYAPYPVGEEDFNTPEFVRNIQDPNYKAELSASNSNNKHHKKPFIYLNNKQNNLLADLDSSHESQSETPHYYNPHAYKTIKPLLLNPTTTYHTNEPLNHLFSTEPLTGFVPNEFPPRGQAHRFYNFYKNPESYNKHSSKENNIISDTPIKHHHNYKPLEIIPLSPHLGHRYRQGYSTLMPNAGVLIPTNERDVQIPGYGLLVYNPVRGSPYYLIPTHPPLPPQRFRKPSHNLKYLDSFHLTGPFNYKRNAGEHSAPQPTEIIYGERNPGRNYFFGRKVKF